jgi:hypothetical protein
VTDDVTCDVRFNLEVRGEAELSERGEKCWDTADLLAAALETASFSVEFHGGPDEEEYRNRVVIEISDYHILNAEGDRAFHMHLRALLRWKEVDALHRYLGYLLANHRGDMP